MYLRLASLLGTLVIIGAGCSSLSIKRYEIKDGTKQKVECPAGGFEFPRQDPYLLVTRTEADKPATSVQVIYLPNWAHTTVVKQRPFMGSAEMGFTLSGPMLTTFNAKQDAQVDEAMTSAVGILGGIASAATGIGGAASGIAGALGSATTFATTLDEIISRYLKASAPSALSLKSVESSTIPAWVDTKEEKAVYGALATAVEHTSRLALALAEGSKQKKSATELLSDIRDTVEVRLPETRFTNPQELALLKGRITQWMRTLDKELPLDALPTAPGQDAKSHRIQLGDTLADATKALDAVLGLLGAQPKIPFELYRIEENGVLTRVLESSGESL